MTYNRLHAIAGRPPFATNHDRACAGMPTELFYPERGFGGYHLERARGICHTCPYEDECREWAIDHYERGVWGATSETERQTIRHQRRLHALATAMHASTVYAVKN